MSNRRPISLLAALLSVLVSVGMVAPAAPAASAASVTEAQTTSTMTAPGHTHGPGAAPAAQPPVEPAGYARLMHQVQAEEDQLVSLAVIPEARSFLRQAKVGQSTAQERLDSAVSVWDGDKLMEARAHSAQVTAMGLVNFYQQALGQLGLAEYTGQPPVHGSGLLAQENALDQDELANVAAGVATARLHQEHYDLAVDRRASLRWEAAAGHAQVTMARAQAGLQRADAQLALSGHDVLVAERWATQTGAAPVSPVEALVRLEGHLGRSRRARRRAVALADLSTTTTSTTTTALAGTTTTTTTVAPRAATANATTTTKPSLTTLASAAGQGPRILGPSLLSAAEVEGWFESTGNVANTTVPLGKLVPYYIKAGQATGVRADIAFAQSVVETGHFSFPAGGQLTAKDNNFAGIGACDSCKHGWKFPSAQAGVMAQLQLLESYATVPTADGDASPIADAGVEGCCQTWLGLSGVWASNPDYGYEILGIYEEMLAWAIPRQLMANGLLSPMVLASEALAQVAVGASGTSPDMFGAGSAPAHHSGDAGPPVPPGFVLPSRNTTTTTATVAPATTSTAG